MFLPVFLVIASPSPVTSSMSLPSPAPPFPACSSQQRLTPLLCSLQKDELYLNLVLEYVPETVYAVERSGDQGKFGGHYLSLVTWALCDFF